MNNVPHWREEEKDEDFNALKPPAVSNDLVAFLEQAFPDKLPTDLRIDEREIWAKIGQQRVVSLLRELAGRRT